MSAHRYWRLLIDRTNDNNAAGAAITELQLRTSIGGANVATTAANWSASSTESFRPVSNLVDGNTSTSWRSTAVFPVWVQYDFGGSPQDIVEVAIGPDSSNYSRTLNTFSLQYSDDGSSWTTLFGISDYADWTGTALVAFNAGDTVAGLASGQAWRLYVTAAAGGGTTVGTTKIQMRATAGGADLCTGGRALASSQSGLNPGSSAFDAGTTSQWASSTGGLPGWIGYKFAAPVSVAEITVRAGTSTGQSLAAFALEKWNGSAWVQVGSWTGQNTWAIGETKTFTMAPPAVVRPQVFVC